MTIARPEITSLLQAWEGGDRDAFDRLMPVVYAELRRAAQAYMRRERTNHTLQATALVNEVYLRLVEITSVRWQDRAHFFAMAASMMRRVLLDAARARSARKRGGGDVRVTLDEELLSAEASRQAASLMEIDQAIEALSKLDPRKARVVELRFFGGLSVDEMAAVLEISSQSVKRDWKLARAWLLKELAGTSV
ncbi:MAG TPA: sigma-70 family RNA polymerase sigma factor [Bryobacteraceae bacterium]|nr:sigma-70 family RNA polymerase sigma factor [Bryobacteraceae bacterium]